MCPPISNSTTSALLESIMEVLRMGRNRKVSLVSHHTATGRDDPAQTSTVATDGEAWRNFWSNLQLEFNNNLPIPSVSQTTEEVGSVRVQCKWFGDSKDNGDPQIIINNNNSNLTSKLHYFAKIVPNLPCCSRLRWDQLEQRNEGLLSSIVFEWQLLITLHWDSVERPGFWCQGWFLVLLTAKEVICFVNLMDVLEKAANVFWPWNSRKKSASQKRMIKRRKSCWNDEAMREKKNPAKLMMKENAEVY